MLASRVHSRYDFRPGRRAVVIALAVAALLGMAMSAAAEGESARVGPPVPADVAARLRAAKQVPPAPLVSPRPAASTPGAIAIPAGAAAPASGGSSFAPVLPPANYAPPVLAIENPRHDFGTVFLGEEVVHAFKVSNTGGSDLIISQVKPSCGCTYVDHERVIAPGQSGTITLKVDTKRLRAGKQAKTADVLSNDPKSPKEKLYIEGMVASAFSVTPEYPRIDAIVGDANPGTVIALKKTVDKPFRVTNVAVAPAAAPVNASVPAPERLKAVLVDKGDSSYEIQVTALSSEGMKASNFYDRLTVDILDETTNKILTQDISVTVRFQDRLSINPRTLWFRRNEVQPLITPPTGPEGAPVPAAAAVVTKPVIVKSEVAGFKFNITKLESSDPHFSVTHKAIRDGEEYQVDVKIEKLPEDDKVRSMKSDIKISTDDPTNPELTLRVIAYL